MSQLTNYAENKLADMARGQGLTLPGSWYFGLASAASDSAVTELTGTGYAREAVARSLANFAGTQAAGSVLASSGTSHATSNNGDVDFGNAGSAWGTASHLVLFDASTAGNAWMLFELETPLVIGNGDPVLFEAGSVAFTLGLAGGMSHYLANKLIDLIFRGQAYTWPASLYAALYTSATTGAGGGTEVSGGGYARPALTSSLAALSGTQAAGSTVASSGTGGRISNNAEITFAAAPSADWGDVTHGALRDAATLGNLMWHGALNAPKSIVAGAAAPKFSADTIGLTWA